ncbi:MAG TPA: flagellar biosynthesis protein [Albitalea sp.]|nr:flagellar biosynthesis protein [Albitalea sp.]
MNTRSLYAVALLCAGTFLGGCATTRSELKLASPAPVAQAPANGRSVVIRSIKDERIFEQAPQQASTPSLGFEGALKATDEVKARAVGRKRGGFGMALGDVLLQNGQTVVGLVRENLSAAFQQAGYRVVDEAAAGPSPLVLDVHIKQFWSWFQPGFWAITLNANIETTLVPVGTAAPATVSVHVENSGMAATEGAWLEILDKALVTYRTQAAAKLAEPPF